MEPLQTHYGQNLLVNWQRQDKEDERRGERTLWNDGPEIQPLTTSYQPKVHWDWFWIAEHAAVEWQHFEWLLNTTISHFWIIKVLINWLYKFHCWMNPHILASLSFLLKSAARCLFFQETLTDCVCCTCFIAVRAGAVPASLSWSRWRSTQRRMATWGDARPSHTLSPPPQTGRSESGSSGLPRASRSKKYRLPTTIIASSYLSVLQFFLLLFSSISSRCCPYSIGGKKSEERMQCTAWPAAVTETA